MPPYGGDSYFWRRCRFWLQFQSMPPYGGDLSRPMKLGLLFRFQSMPPYGGDGSGSVQSPRSRDFNPCPHTGATSHVRGRRSRWPISIHAPIRGRRCRKEVMTPHGRISIHAPIRGRPASHSGIPSAAGYFNPCPHTGATVFLRHSSTSFRYFNPCPHTGATTAYEQNKEDYIFQSMPPYGGDCQTGQLEFLKFLHLFPRKAVSRFSNSRFQMLVLSVRFPLALAGLWKLLNCRSV